MVIRYRVQIDVDVEGKDLPDIADKFMELDLGALEKAKAEKAIRFWDYVNTYSCHNVDEETGRTVGMELPEQP